MRWKMKPKPEVGNERIVGLFLFWPTRIGNEVRWLEWATIYQEYYCRKTVLGATEWGWENIYTRLLQGQSFCNSIPGRWWPIPTNVLRFKSLWARIRTVPRSVHCLLRVLASSSSAY